MVWEGTCQFEEKSIFDILLVYGLSYTDTIIETSIDLIPDSNDTTGQKQTTTSLETICDYKRYFREICMNIVMDESHYQIGGPGK